MASGMDPGVKKKTDRLLAERAANNAFASSTAQSNGAAKRRSRRRPHLCVEIRAAFPHPARRRDRLVPLTQSEVLHKAFLAAGADSTLVAIEGADRWLRGVQGDGAVERDIAFLRSKLGNHSRRRPGPHRRPLFPFTTAERMA